MGRSTIHIMVLFLSKGRSTINVMDFFLSTGRSNRHIRWLAILTNPPFQIPFFLYMHLFIILLRCTSFYNIYPNSKLCNQNEPPSPKSPPDNKRNLIYCTAKHMN